MIPLIQRDRPVALEIDGRNVPLRLRRSARASRMSLKVDLQDGAVVLVLPPHTALAQGLAFARAKADWLAARLAALPDRVPFADGMALPLLGEPHVLRHAPAARRGVWVEAGGIHVSGRAEHFSRRVADWLRQRALAEIEVRARPMAEQLGVRFTRLALRDPRSRWGSCNSRGHLAFSWRLVLAPAPVLAYVVAHEVAHLREMNHSPAFWRLVSQLMPEAPAARRWLKTEGAGLYRYG